MKKATRTLLSKSFGGNLQLVTVRALYFEQAIENHCYQNTMEFLRSHLEWTMHSGWLVGDFLGEHGTAIIPHYWVTNSSNEHYDVTPRNPLDVQKYDYVSDLAIAEHATTSAAVPAPLMLSGDGELYVHPHNGQCVKIERIDYELLFNLAPP